MRLVLIPGCHAAADHSVADAREISAGKERDVRPSVELKRAHFRGNDGKGSSASSSPHSCKSAPRSRHSRECGNPVFALPCLAVALAATFATLARAEPPAWIDAAYYAFDSAKTTANGALGAQQLAQKTYGQPALRLDPGIPAGIPISALSIDGDDIYLVTAVMWRMDGQLVTPRDVVKIASGGAASIAVKGSDMGLPPASRIAALSVRSGETLFSLDIHADFGGFKARPSDILQWDGNALSKPYSADTLGIPASTKLTALDRTATGSLLMAFDAGADIHGIQTMPGDLLEYRPTADAWSRARARKNLGVNCSPCDLTAIAADTNASTVFRDGLETD